MLQIKQDNLCEVSAYCTVHRCCTKLTFVKRAWNHNTLCNTCLDLVKFTL